MSGRPAKQACRPVVLLVVPPSEPTLSDSRLSGPCPSIERMFDTDQQSISSAPQAAEGSRPSLHSGLFVDSARCPFSLTRPAATMGAR
jgi:hypothetical protein